MAKNKNEKKKPNQANVEFAEELTFKKNDSTKNDKANK